MPLCRQRRSKPRTRRRLIGGGARHNIASISVPDKHRAYLADLYTTMLDMQWRWVISIFVGVFSLGWLTFGAVYFLFASVHGDLDNPDSESPCMDGVVTFTSAYLFSIETMTTIGYGSRQQTEACPGVYLVVMLQSIVGAALQVALASVVVSKIRRAKGRIGTVLLSDKVCVYEEDANLQLAIRVGDMRESDVAGAHAQGFLIKKHKTDNGYVPVRSYQMEFTSESGRGELFLSWPTMIVHKVDDTSPLWTLSRDELLGGSFELIVAISGTCITTSTPFQMRKSYHTSEIHWGRRFSDLELTVTSGDSYDLNLSTFHQTEAASTVLCSAKDITNFRRLYSSHHHDPGEVSPAHNTRHAHTEADPPPRRSVSVAAVATGAASTCKERARRCSLGDLVRSSQGNRNNSQGNALNKYRHRPSVTDTYLGCEVVLEDMEEDEEESEAIRSVVSTRSLEKHIDVRDVFKKRRASVTQLCFTDTDLDTGIDSDTSNTSHEVTGLKNRDMDVWTTGVA